MTVSSRNGRLTHGATFALLVGVLATGASGLLTAEIDTTQQAKTDHPILAPCTRYENRYDNLGFRYAYQKTWSDRYHEKVNAVIEDHLKQPKLTCSASDYEAFLQPGTELLTLAASLPTWNDPAVRVTRYDLGRVLLEYLRVYECAMYEYEQMAYTETQAELSREEDDGISAPDPDPEVAKVFLNLFMPQLSEKTAERVQKIQQEQLIARRALNRALSIVSAMDRLRPVEMELQCLQQMSLDIRNITALSAETSACLPRAWNGKDILRDIKEE